MNHTCFLHALQRQWVWLTFLGVMFACNLSQSPPPPAQDGLLPPTPLRTTTAVPFTPITPTVSPAVTAFASTSTATPPSVTVQPTQAIPTLAAGETCVIQTPAGWVAYQVRQGDTLSQLAQRGNVAIGDLMRVNCRPSDQLFAGELLYVPSAVTFQPTSSPTASSSPSLPSPTVTNTIMPPTATLETPRPSDTPLSPTAQPSPLPTSTMTNTPEPPTSTPTISPPTPVTPPPTDEAWEPPPATEQPDPLPLVPP